MDVTRRKIVMAGAMAPVAAAVPGGAQAQAAGFYRDKLVNINVAGGAAGNLIDRVRWGEVVDFIDWYARSYHWPTFNIADSAISVGVGLLVIDMLFSKPQKV